MLVFLLVSMISFGLAYMRGLSLWYAPFPPVFSLAMSFVAVVIFRMAGADGDTLLGAALLSSVFAGLCGCLLLSVLPVDDPSRPRVSS